MDRPNIVLTETDIDRIRLLSPADLARLYTAITERVQAARQREPNETVLTLRASLRAVNHVNALALRHATTRSGVLRDALDEFLRRHPV